MSRYQLTIQFDTPAELADQLATIIDATARVMRAPIQATAQTPAGADPVNFCSGGHGAMRLIPGGTARSGPRQGQTYPAFYKCDRCGERQELRP